jgi:hypothetical protein
MSPSSSLTTRMRRPAENAPRGGVLLLPLMLLVTVGSFGCAPASPRFGPTERAETEPQAVAAAAQRTDLAGELLVAPPEQGAEQLIGSRPEAVLPLAGILDPLTTGTVDTIPPPGHPAVAPPPVALAPPPDTLAIRTPPAGPRREYQVQVAITPSAEEAEEFQLRLAGLLPQEEVFIVFTRPYYRIRVGRKPERSQAEVVLGRLVQLGYENAMIIPVTITPDGDGR